MKSKKTISFCITGRNDNYTGDFKYRITTSINYLAWTAKNLDVLDQIEILVTDWNSDTPLYKDISLSTEASQITSFILVPPIIAKKYHNQFDGQLFNTTCSLNAAVKRASGSFIAIMPADCFFPSVPLLNFLQILNKTKAMPFEASRCLFKISRRMIPNSVWKDKPDTKSLEKILSSIGGNFAYSPDTAHDISSGLGIIAASRNIFHETQGFDESISGWGHSDTEFGLRVEQKYPSHELSHYGIWAYDLEANLNLAASNQKQRLNQEIYHNTLKTNNDNWGLDNENLEVVEFSNSSIIKPANNINSSVIIPTKFESRCEIIESMANKKYHYFLKENLPFSKNFPVSWKIYYPLIWYGLNYKPNKYLEFGVTDECGAPAISLAKKFIKLFIVSDWDNKSNMNKDLSILDIFAILKSVSYQEGMCKFIEGDPHTALERIDSMEGTETFYDLILFQADLFEKKAVDILLNLISKLSDNGAIVVKSTNRQLFLACWEMVVKVNPKLTFIKCFKDEVGIILNTEFEDNSIKANQKTEIQDLKKFWRPIKKRLIIYYFSRVIGIINLSVTSCIYEPFWRWPMKIKNIKNK